MVDAIKHVQDFFRRSFVFGSIYGIPLRIDYTWCVVFFLLIWLVAAYMTGDVNLTFLARTVLSVLTVTVFFVTLLAHEYAHAFVARREGIPVIEIHLHPFGGVASLRREPETPGSELRIAIAGPLMSLFMACLFGGLYFLAVSGGVDVLASLLFVIFLLNLFLAVFNMFPGFPLDGGRVMRAILRKKGMELSDATSLTAKFGQIFGAIGIASGIFLIVINRDWLTGLWSVMVGAYLFSIAWEYVGTVDKYKSLNAGHFMELPVPVDPEMTIQEFVDKIVVFHRQVVFPVAIKRQLFGFLRLADVKKNYGKDDWSTVRVMDAMRPVREDFFVDLDAEMSEVKELLRINEVGIIGVLDSKGGFVGTIQKGRIRRRN